MKRRDFLISGSTLGFSGLVYTATAKDLRKLGSNEANWADLINLLNGNIYFVHDDGYSEKARVNNMRFMGRLPQAVAIIDTVQKAQLVIQWLQANRDVKFCVKGGGHSYAGFSICDGLVLFTEGLNEITRDNDEVTVGAGARNYKVVDALTSISRTITHGRCPTVGVAGFLLGGGIGFDMRNFGMGCDLVTRAEIVTAQGKLLTVSADQNADLFWALRGGTGGSFGLSTSFTLKTKPLASDINIQADQLEFRSESLPAIAKFLNAFMVMCENAPRSLGTRFSVQYIIPVKGSNAPYFKISFLGQWVDVNAQNSKKFFEEVYRLADASRVTYNRFLVIMAQEGLVIGKRNIC